MGKWQSAVENMVMNRGFWIGKRVLVTGHTGFKGSWLSLWLQSMGAQVIGYALAPPTKPNLFESAKVGHDMISNIGDIRDLVHLTSVFREYKPEIVIHMAAQTLVRYSYAEPVETYSTNMMGTVNLLEAVRKTTGVKAVVNVTSDKCYENREWMRGYRENDAMGGYDPYSSSKGCAELVTAAYRNSYFNPESYEQHGIALASARAGNVIGGGDWAEDRLIPDVLRAITQTKSAAIRNPLSIRPWQHVLEPLSGYLLLAQKLYEVGSDFSEGWNFGPKDDDVKTVQWICDQLTNAWGNGAHWELDKGDHPHEARHLKLDSTKAKERLHWQPRWTLAEAIEHIGIWHRAHLAGGDMQAMCFHQIKQYETTPL
jgi:CDP-glucose 4,6-dehydratase